MHAADPKLSGALVFKGVPSEMLQPLLSAAQIQNYRSEAVIFPRGAPATQVFVVLSGLVRISTMAQSGRKVTVEIFKEGELFGELALIDNLPRTADATAMGPARLAALPGASFRSVLETVPGFAVNLLRMVTGRLRHTYAMLEDASLTDIEHRLARQVLYLVGLGASGERRVRLFTRLNQGDLADLLGTTQRTIITILNKWRAEGLVDFDGRTAQLTILEIERFRALIETIA